jgi:hypothetical protein
MENGDVKSNRAAAIRSRRQHGLDFSFSRSVYSGWDNSRDLRSRRPCRLSLFWVMLASPYRVRMLSSGVSGGMVLGAVGRFML